MKRRITLLAACGFAGLAFLGLLLRPEIKTTSTPESTPAVAATSPTSRAGIDAEHNPSSVSDSAPTNSLFRTASHHWHQPIPEEPFAVFHDWTERYLAAATSERAGMIAEGVTLAQVRRAALKALIQTDPERALELTVPQAVQRALPTEIVSVLEERVSGRGRLAVLAALAESGKEGDVVPTFRKAEFADREFDAFVYGRRLGEPTRADIPLNGIAVDNFFAANENPVRMLEPEEAEDALAQNAEALCSVSSLPATVNQQPVVAEVAGQTLFFCQPKHAVEENERMVAAEGGPPTGEGGDPEAAAWTEGQKKLIIIRVDFSDLVGVNLTDSGAVTLINNLNTFYTEMSYGRAGFFSNSLGSDFTPVFRMPQPAAYYGTNNYYDQLRTAARDAATAAGYTLANYNLDVICFGSVPGWGWAGLGYVGAAGSWLRNSFGTGVAGHELGHNYGLNHASSWDTGGASVTGPGTSSDYGDSFDTMGSASAGNNHFNARYKNYLNWLTASEVITATSNGIYRIYAHDNPSSTGLRGLRIVKNSSTNYWVEFRQKFTSNKWLMSGGGLRWAQNGNQKSQLLDTTPGTTDGKTDSAIVIGRTFSDRVANIHLTPIGKGGTIPESLDVVVNLGAFPGNQVPTVGLVASATNAGTGVTLTFNALATDADGDPLAYYWDFGDGNFGTNGPLAAKSWAAIGEYVVRCEVSDMKGGVGSQSAIVSIGSPTTYRIAGQVQSSNGPVQGVRVSVSTTRMTWTDSDGTYTIVGLPAGSYTVSSSLENYSFSVSDFTNPVSVGPNAAGINFVAAASGLTPPGITTQPLSQTVGLGANVTFNVTATGTAPLSYQWRFNGANLAGATGASYVKSNVQATNAGNYSVVASNAAGTVTSANAVLAVNSPPLITTQPQSQTVIGGNVATFSVGASGSSPLAYQWRLSGTNLPGANSSTHSIANVQSGHAGDYCVVVTNSLGAVTSGVAALTVNYTVTATASPGGTVNQTPNQSSYAPGHVVALTAAPASSFPFSGWSGAASGTNNPLNLTVTTNLTIIANFASPVPDLIVDNPQAVLTGAWAANASPPDQYNSNCVTISGTQTAPNATATFAPNIATTGRYDVYVWHPTISRGAVSVPVEISSSEGTTNLTVNQTVSSGGWWLIAPARMFAAGTNGFVRIANNVGQGGRTVVADAARWVYAPNQGILPPSITAQPTNFIVIAGQPAAFHVDTDGTPPLSFQWRFNQQPLSNAVASSLAWSTAPPSAAGVYDVLVSNAAGTVTSASANLVIRLRPLLNLGFATSNGQPHLTLTGTPGDRYVIEASTNLLDWNSVLTVTNASGATLFTDPAWPLETRKFYRAWLVP